MVALGNGVMPRGPLVYVVAFENSYPVKVVGEHLCRHQSCQTSANDDRLVPKVLRHVYASIDDVHLICASIDNVHLRRHGHASGPGRVQVRQPKA
jgi:hypothetical protein